VFAVICRNKGPGKYGKLIVTAETQKGRKGDKVLTLQFYPPLCACLWNLSLHAKSCLHDHQNLLYSCEGAEDLRVRDRFSAGLPFACHKTDYIVQPIRCVRCCRESLSPPRMVCALTFSLCLRVCSLAGKCTHERACILTGSSYSSFLCRLSLNDVMMLSPLGPRTPLIFPPAGMFGKSDPYYVLKRFRRGTEEVAFEFKSEYISQNLNPVWKPAYWDFSEVSSFPDHYV
jgi:hypothetical protein